MVDDHRGVRVTTRQFRHQGKFARAHHVYGNAGFSAAGEYCIQPCVISLVLLSSEHYAGTYNAGCGSPIRNIIGRGYRVGIEWSDQAKAAGVFRVYLKGVTGVVLVKTEGRDQYGTVNTNLVHGLHHVVAGHLIWTLQEPCPGPGRMVPLVGVYLYVDREWLRCHGAHLFLVEIYRCDPSR